MVGPLGELGLYAREGDHVVVDLPRCRVVTAPIAEVSRHLRDLLARRDDDAAAAIRAVDLRALGDGASSVWVTLVVVKASVSRDRLEGFGRELARRAPDVRSIFVNEVASREAVQVLGPKTYALFGADEAWDSLAGVRILAAPGAFVQAHSGQAEVIAARLRARVRGLRETCGRPPKVLDVFSGSGTWGLAVAAEGADVIAIESFAPAAERIAAAAKAARVSVEARTGDAEPSVSRIAQAGARVDLVIVNPPRRGLTPGLRAAIAALAPRAVAYVSCDPDTLARDLADFARLGLGAASLSPIDMIPLTEHVETLCFLEPRAVPSPRVLGESPRLIAVEKPAHEAEDALVHRMRASPGERLLFAPPNAGSGVAIFTHGPDHVDAEPAQAKALVGVKGVMRARGHLRRRRAAGSVRYERLAVGSGHSLLRVSGLAADVSAVCEPLAAIGHPVLGDRRTDPRTRRHFADRYGLDRAFLHITSVELDGAVFECSLAPDLALVAERLGLASRSLSTG
jgi:23S rRNA (uracil1939-C5)-methyltransferase